MHIQHPIQTVALAFIMLVLPLALQPKPTAQPEKPAAQPKEPEKPKPNPAVIPVERPDDYCKERHARFNARAKQGHEKGDIDLIFIGDSITQAWENEGKDVWAKYYAKRNAVNCGTGGDETQHVIWRLQNGNVEGLDKPQPKDAKPPHLAIVMIGTNNLGNSSYSPEQTAEGVKAVVTTLREKLPHTKVLLLAIFPRGEKADDPLRKKVAQTNQFIKADVKMKDVEYLDIGESFVQKDGTISKDIMPDSLHLSPAGYEIEAKAIESKVHEMLGEK